MGSLADRVNEMENECDELEGQISNLEDELNKLEQQLEDAHDDINRLKDFEDWVHDAYPDVYKAYECLNDLKEKSNGV